MKIKTDFVTNSSCASFVIEKDKLTNLQIVLIKNHVDAAKMYSQGKVFSEDGEFDFGWPDEWNITETKNSIAGETSMDNFDMLAFLVMIGINEDDVQYEGCY
jgi:hypothetical protein